MANRNGSSSGRGRKKGLLGAVRRHPLRTAGIAAGAVLGLAILRKATNGDAAGGAARKTAGRARGRRTSARSTSARGMARGGRAGARARGGRSQARAETGRTE